MRHTLTALLTATALTGAAHAQTAPHDYHGEAHPARTHGVVGPHAAVRHAMHARMGAAAPFDLQGAVGHCMKFAGTRSCEIDMGYGTTAPLTSTLQVDPTIVSISNGTILCNVPNGTACVTVSPASPAASNIQQIHALTNVNIVGTGSNTGTGLYMGTPAAAGVVWNYDDAMALDRVSIRDFAVGLELGSNTYATDFRGVSIGNNTVGVEVDPKAVNSGERISFVLSALYNNGTGIIDTVGYEWDWIASSFDFNGLLANMFGQLHLVASHVENGTQTGPSITLGANPNMGAGAFSCDVASSWTVDGYNSKSVTNTAAITTVVPWGGVSMCGGHYGFNGTQGAITGPGVAASFNAQGQPWNNATMAW